MNLYIISNVLWHYSRGMCVIAAESMSHCEEIYVKKFEDYELVVENFQENQKKYNKET